MYQWNEDHTEALINICVRAALNSSIDVKQALFGILSDGLLVFPQPENTPDAQLRLAVEIAETIVGSEHADDGQIAYAETFLDQMEHYRWLDDLDDGDEVATGDFTGGGVAEALDKMFDPGGADGITVAEWQRQYLGDWVPEEDGPVDESNS